MQANTHANYLNFLQHRGDVYLMMAAPKTAAAAAALGMHDAINLDGGGSTAMSANGALINRPKGGN